MADSKKPKMRITVASKMHRRSARVASASKSSQTNEPDKAKAANPASKTNVKAKMSNEYAALSEYVDKQFNMLSRKLSQLVLDRQYTPSDDEKKESSVEPRASIDSEATVVPPQFPTTKSRETEICAKLFSPVESLPDYSELRERLLDDFVEPIPIHRHAYEKLKSEVAQEVLSNFCIVEEVGNTCPTLTPYIESALNVTNVGRGTESMQQHVLDKFLMGIISTAQSEIASVDILIDRNAAENSVTKKGCRPDFLFSINGQLVFKGEEKKAGDVRKIAMELTDKMIPGSVGKGATSRIQYLLGYATAGSRVLFECIHGDDKMVECSNILNLERIPDRVTMIRIIVNVVRIALSLTADTK
ncbi:hypothetical protein LPJ73_005767 [Coemansia sp. RSA 2703]|nr:hypothetical protein LPJ73_005767 [Coemansia sp. RSA 2703]KAJ2371811.1 hypothetical protein IW150_004422 [Coemansia sp. RSA 2607]KAJ2394580.1 hypothetical protein GGI05_001977 [Coemansia sp. RSA 2603]